MFKIKVPLRTVITIIFYLNHVCSDNLYAVPEPKIEIFPKGFRFSIPHVDGIDLFAFHGNINLEMNGLEAGEYSKDIVKKCGDLWIFETNRQHNMAVGDIIYYWLFIIKNGLGYRYDDGEFVVKEIVAYTSSKCNQQENNRVTNAWIHEIDKLNQEQTNPIFDVRLLNIPIPKQLEKRHLDAMPNCNLLLNVSYLLTDVLKENMKLVRENQILTQLLQKDEYYSKTLRIFGKYPVKYYPTPKDFVQRIIIDKLQLNDVKVTEAKSISDNGISFKVETLRDKIDIIQAAEKGLKGSLYEISW